MLAVKDTREGVIITLSGRICSGKSTLSQYLVNLGFVKLAFADYLKLLVSQLYGWSLDSLNDQNAKNKELSSLVVLGDTEYDFIESVTSIKIMNRPKIEFFSKRQALQYIGTDVLRAIDKNFHVTKVIEKIQNDRTKSYVIDDLRFPSELAAIKQFTNVLPVYLARPSFFESYSNHASELALSRKDFEYVLMNNTDKATFLKSFVRLVDTFMLTTPKYCRKEIQKLLIDYDYKTSEIAQSLGCSTDKIVWWSRNWGIHLDRTKYKYNHDFFLVPNKLNSYLAGLLSGDGCVKFSGRSKVRKVVEFTSTDYELVKMFRTLLAPTKPICTKVPAIGKVAYSIVLGSSYIVEDMKLWSIEPRKSKYNKIPDCIRDNRDLMKCWVTGLIDSGGCIKYSTARNKKGLAYTPTITILASKEVIEYLRQFYPHGGMLHQEKDIENLYTLSFHGKNAVAFYNEIKCEFGLNRKWDKMKLFVDKKWKY